MNNATPLHSNISVSVIFLSHDSFFLCVIGAFRVQQFYLICFGKQHDWMVFHLKAMRGLTADTSPVTSMWFFSFMPWHSKRAAWSAFNVPSLKLTKTMLKNGLHGIPCNLNPSFSYIFLLTLCPSHSFVIEISGSKILWFTKSSGIQSSTTEPR